MHVNGGHRLSLQYHEEKLETLCLATGRVLLTVEDAEGRLQELEMEPGWGYTIAPLQRHRLAAIEDAEVYEVSTPESGTMVRLADDYQRTSETEARRASDRGVRQGTEQER